MRNNFRTRRIVDCPARTPGKSEPSRFPMAPPGSYPNSINRYRVYLREMQFAGIICLLRAAPFYPGVAELLEIAAIPSRMDSSPRQFWFRANW